MTYTQTRIRRDYLKKLQLLAEREQRSMMKELEYLIDIRLVQVQKGGKNKLGGESDN